MEEWLYDWIKNGRWSGIDVEGCPGEDDDDEEEGEDADEEEEGWREEGVERG